MSVDLTMWSSEAWSSAADVQLLARSREGSAEAFGELWRRHLPAAYAVAGRVRGRTSPEDVVAEAAARVFSLIKEGRGPEEHFRAYFLSAVRTVALDSSSRDLRVVPTEEDDLDALAEPVGQPEPDLGDDETVALVREAFRSLPEKDQRLLWHTTVEGAAPRVVAPTLGLTPNAVSVRAMRARENLRALYLEARAERGLAEADTDECRWTITHLGALVRGRLPKRQTERAQAHVASCSHAARLADDLRVIHDGFPALIVPLVLAAGVSTPGFVTAGGLGLLGGAAGAAGAGGLAAAASPGGAAAAGTAGVSGASRLGSGADAMGQVASRVASLVAGVAVTAGATGLLGAPASTTLPADAAPRPPASASASPGATGAGSGGPTRSGGASSSPVAGPSPTSSGAIRTGATSAAAAIPSAGSTAGVTGTPAPPAPGRASGPGAVGSPGSGATSGATGGAGGGGTPVTRPPSTSTPPPPPTTRPAPPPTTRPAPPPPTSTPPPPPPTSEPPPEPANPPTISAKVIASGDPSRFSLSIRTTVAGRLRITVSNASGGGTLIASNSAWTCSNTGPARVACTGSASGGRVQLTQGGLGRLSPVTVVVTDGAGDTYRRTLFG